MKIGCRKKGKNLGLVPSADSRVPKLQFTKPTTDVLLRHAYFKRAPDRDQAP